LAENIIPENKSPGYIPLKTISGRGYWPKLNNSVLLAKVWVNVSVRQQL